MESSLVRRIGSNEERLINCRIIASINGNIENLLQDGKLRPDLLYRFRYRIHLAPLRERASDIPLLASYFMNYDAKRLNIAPKKVEDAAMDIMLRYLWPGNIRELESVLDILMISVDDEVIRREDVSRILSQHGYETASKLSSSVFLRTQRIPYYFGPAVSDPARFFGRKEEMEEIIKLLKQSEYGSFWPIAVIGDHRLGKSSLLKILDSKIPSISKCLSIYIDIASIGEDQFFEIIIKRVAECVYSKSPESLSLKSVRKAWDQKQWKSLLGEIDIDIMGFFKFTKKVSSERDWEEFGQILIKLRNRLEEFGDYSSIVIMLDEVSACASWKGCPELLKIWRSYVQSLNGYNFLIADAHPLYQLSKDKWSAFFNVFRQVQLGALKPEEAEELIVKPAEEVEVTYTPEAIAAIRDLSSCKPFYIQIICCTIFEQLLKMKDISYVDKGLVDISIDSVLERLNEHFSSLWSDLTAFQKKYLLESIHKHTHKLASIDETNEYETQRNQIRLLQERQLITIDDYHVDHIEPLFEVWIKRYFTHRFQEGELTQNY